MTPREKRAADLLAARARIDAELKRLGHTPEPPRPPLVSGVRVRRIPPEAYLTGEQIRENAKAARVRALNHYNDTRAQQDERLRIVNTDADTLGWTRKHPERHGAAPRPHRRKRAAA